MATAATRLRRSLRVLAGTHVGLSLTSIGYGFYYSGGETLHNASNDEVFDARHYDIVTELVTSMYSGRGLKHPYCRLAETISFEDSAAICMSPKETQEAFRALRAVEPQCRSPPKCIHVQPLGSSIALTYALNQRYLGGWFDLQSLLVMEVELIAIKDQPGESEFLVNKMEERWKGIAPLPTYLFRLPRRINGLLSYQLTSRLVQTWQD
jgi:hypothetical protein